MKRLSKPAATFLIFIFFLFNAPKKLCAQQTKSFSGRVMQSNLANGIANLPVIGLSETSADTVLTNSEGYFSFPDGTQLKTLKISAPEYQSFEKNITPDSSGLLIRLERQFYVRAHRDGSIPPTAAPPSYTIIFLPVEITAFATQQKLLENPGPIALLEKNDLNRFNNNSLVSAVNTIAGVRLEERAPASYRFSIRGSTLRAPFGVRNVKVYLNEIPFTEANGNTFLNLLDPATIGSVEILKGPSGSLYGAGTGGVVFLKSARLMPGQTFVKAETTVGSYGLKRYVATAQTASETGNLSVQYAQQDYDGYRQQSALNRKTVFVNGQSKASEKSTLSAQLLYSNLYYEIPGALTKEQFEQNPRQVRPISITNTASIDLEAVQIGLSQQYRFSESTQNTSSVYGSFSFMDHPFTLNYERNFNQGFGGRTATSWFKELGKIPVQLVLGGEFQTGLIGARKFENNGGQTGALQLDDEIKTTTGIVFTQTEFTLPQKFILTAGASLNTLKYRIHRITDNLNASPGIISKTYDPVFSPRLALVKLLNSGNEESKMAIYGSISTGFSPPSQPEVFTDDGTINLNLKPERGLNYELGFRGAFLEKRLHADVTAFALQLNQTVVSRRENRNTPAGPAEVTLYENAGKTAQNGAEVAVSFELLRSSGKLISGLKLWQSYAYHHFRFKNYAKEGQDFSGNKLTGAPEHTAASGLDLHTRLGFYLNATANYVSEIPLNDANTVFADAYFIAGFRAGYRKMLKNIEIDLYGGIDNATDQHYSLGNDLNAFGGRYFQPAPARNYYGGLSIQYKILKKPEKLPG